MARQTFIKRRFQQSTLVKIGQANKIIDDYLPRGFRLTIRQLHYQFVARGLYENTERSYKNLINTMRDARLAGLVDWDAIEDRTRTLQGGRGGWNGPADFIANVVEQYAEDWWQEQPYRPEVWIEKAALLGVIEDVCDRYGVRYYASRGDDAKSPSYDAGARFRKLRWCCTSPTMIRAGCTSHPLSSKSSRCSPAKRSRSAASRSPGGRCATRGPLCHPTSRKKPTGSTTATAMSSARSAGSLMHCRRMRSRD
jgi:hypothetical protein